MPPKTKELLDNLQERIGAASMSETIRRALSLLDVISKEEAKGGECIIQGQDGIRTRIRMI